MRNNHQLHGVSMSQFLQRSAAMLIAFFLCVTQVLAGPPGALLQPTGTVTVNGSRVTAPTVLFPGDKVQTAEKSLADISAMGNMIVLGANTDVIYGNGQLEMGCGNAVVNTTSGNFKVISKTYTAQPAPGTPARFELLQGGGKLKTVVYKGSVSVTAAQKSPTALSAGRSMILAGLTGCAGLAALSTSSAAAAAAAGAASAATAAASSRTRTPSQPQASPSTP